MVEENFERIMGKLSHNLHLHHFSHPHLLELTNTNNTQPLNFTPCSACKLPIISSEWIYSCKLCNFVLHTSCSQLPQLITHPAHPGHPLTLLPTPAYRSAGFFNCDACGQRGHGFSYHCSQCEFDIHSVCASKPLSIFHQSHPCQLQLFFDPPYQTKGFSCDVCRQIGSNHWLYRCNICNFDVHLGCVTTAATTATYNTNTTRQANTQFHQVQPRTIAPISSFSGPNNLQNRNYMQPQSQNTGNALINTLVQGFLDGAAQQVGQNFMQSLAGDNSNDGGTGVMDFGTSDILY